MNNMFLKFFTFTFCSEGSLYIYTVDVKCLRIRVTVRVQLVFLMT